jgi:hypothetical protein
MKIQNFVWLIPAILLAGAFLGCPNGEDGEDMEFLTTPTPKPVNRGVKVTPGIVILGKGFSQQFTATVSGGGGKSFNWTVSGGVRGTAIDNTGLLTVAGNETAQTLVVTAAHSGDHGKYGTAMVRIQENNAAPDGNGLAIDPRTVMLGPGDTQSFEAYFSDDHSEAGGVTWDVDSSDGSAFSDKTLTVAPGEKAETLIVTGSLGDKFGAATVTVLGNEAVPVNNGVQVSPQTGSVKAGESMDFQAYDSTDGSKMDGLSWQVFGGVSGTKISSGKLDVAVHERAAYLTVRAKAANGSFGTAVVEVTGADIGTPSQPITDHGVSVLAASYTVTQGATRRFTQTGAVSVAWSVEGNSEAGTKVSGSGLLRVDSSEPVGTILTVRAVSTTDNDVYGTAQVTVTEYTEPETVNIASRKTAEVRGLKTSKNSWLGSAYGEGVFVISSANGKIFRSEDRGETWTEAAYDGFDGSLAWGMAYGGGVFVAVGYNGKIAYSTDLGESWTNVSPSPLGSVDIYRVRYLNGKFFALSNDNKMAYSSNGIEWTTGIVGLEGCDIRDIAYGAGKFFAVGSGRALMSWSYTGMDNWIRVNNLYNVFDYHVVSIVYADGKFVAGNSIQNGNIGYSAAGDSGWALGVSIGFSIVIIDIAYGAGKFIAVASSEVNDYGNRIVYSDDGVKWDYFECSPCDGVVYGDGRFVISQQGHVIIIGD